LCIEKHLQKIWMLFFPPSPLVIPGGYLPGYQPRWLGQHNWHSRTNRTDQFNMRISWFKKVPEYTHKHTHTHTHKLGLTLFDPLVPIVTNRPTQLNQTTRELVHSKGKRMITLIIIIILNNSFISCDSCC
jgi:hypothetical protein